jgi:hypothetical protein
MYVHIYLFIYLFMQICVHELVLEEWALQTDVYSDILNYLLTKWNTTVQGSYKSEFQLNRTLRSYRIRDRRHFPKLKREYRSIGIVAAYVKLLPRLHQHILRKNTILTDIDKELISELIFHRKYKEKTKELRYSLNKYIDIYKLK